MKRVDAFAQESHDTIVSQCKKMGASLDWSREAFTLDEKRNYAVRVAFKKMYDDGLIYRGFRVVNWDPKGHTTVSDDEVEHKEVKITLYTFRYSKDFPIPIATTRPETKVGDVAVAVHPKGKWKKYVGKVFENISFAGATLNITVVADHNVDEEFGTGALGVTPAHSTIDAEIAEKNGLPMIQVIDEDAKMTEAAGSMIAGLSTLEARKKVVAWLRDHGLLESEEETMQNLSVAERSGGAIEPLPKLQWFIGVNKEFKREGKKTTLKQLMIDAVEKHGVEILPEQFQKTYAHWIGNLRDWCISRQIWYGHRVPAWFRGEELFVGIDAPEGEGWEQDFDTLDTWFSAGLWTFSTLGWPENTEDLKVYHPTSLLETGYDILFFWVARMILMTTYLLDDIPFKTVYLHGLVRDEQGRKMSKSLGNIINPLDMIEKFGTDATRLSLLIGISPGNDMKLSEEKIAGFRNFTNKLWNIGRFMISQLSIFSGTGSRVEHGMTQEEIAELPWEDQWILGRLSEVTKTVGQLFESYDLGRVGELLREFTWNELADWYLEISKVRGNKERVYFTLLSSVLKLWHPFMPFVTEKLWALMHGTDARDARDLLMIAPWQATSYVAVGDQSNVQNFMALIKDIRNQRVIQGVSENEKVEAIIEVGTGYEFVEENQAIIIKLGKIEALELIRLETKPGSKSNGWDYQFKIRGADNEKEKVRLQKELDEVLPYIERLEVKLANDKFVSSAPAKVVSEEREKLAMARLKKEKLEAQLKG